ncbi:hypothetical protein [Flagellimonas marinaquae]|uniref:hypothetical protein n=1 Tax=Flagellimonas marinaquae TaxID=254955 RepID=UPI0020755AD4|nr:hypothetical protein [Allomuricauda aquimarina]USD26072.1 hypothetical protein MJO53_04055 [Allomuricauda aquimarina]
MNKYFILLLISGLVLSSCNKEEFTPFDEAFIHINFNNQDNVEIRSNRRDVVSYYVYLSSKPLNQDLYLDYSIIPGDGLTEGVDYEILTKDNPLFFPIGIYRRPVQIRWMEREVDPTADNTLTIQLDSNNQGINIGFPGPDSNQDKLIFKKVNN